MLMSYMYGPIEAIHSILLFEYKVVQKIYFKIISFLKDVPPSNNVPNHYSEHYPHKVVHDCYFTKIPRLFLLTK